MTFTPDSQFVYYVANEKTGEPNVLYRVPTLGGVRTKILTDIAAPVSFSPDGSEMTFMRGSKETNRSLLLIAASDGTRERILLTGNDGEAFFGGGATRPLTDFTGGDIYNFAFSADGSHLYVARGYGIRNAVLIRNFK